MAGIVAGDEQLGGQLPPRQVGGQLPPGQDYGGEWWQRLATYGVGRAIDYEFLQPFALGNDKMYGSGEDGVLYEAGKKPTLVPGVSNGTLLIGTGVGLLLLFMLLKD